MAAGCTSGAAGRLPGLGELESGLLIDPAEIEKEWARVEATRSAILTRPPLALDGVLRDKRSIGRLATGDELARKAMRSIFAVGAFRDLPEEGRQHPLVQDAMFAAMPEFDEAVFGMQRRIDTLTATERADISRELGKDPELAERVLGMLDSEAAQVGVSTARRLHMRRVGLTACARLHQSSDLFLGELSQKIEKVAARSGSHAEIERRVAATMGERAFSELRERTLRAAASYESYRVAGVRRIPGPDGKPVRGPGEWSDRKKAVLTAGGIVLGVGVLLGGVGGLMLIATFGGAFVLTVAGLAVLAGLITLIVGAAIS